MKTLVAVLLATSVFITVALAIDTSFQTRFITSSTLTIHVKDGQYLTIRSFTQDQDAGQRGTIVAGVPASSPTPMPTAAASPTPTPSPTPNSADLTATKTNNVGGQATSSSQWTWTIHVANRGNTDAHFSLFDVILSDDLPNNNITYGSVSVNPSPTPISCGITSNNLTCSAADSVTIKAGSSFDVSFTANSSVVGTYANPRPGGNCSVDPNHIVAESDENNNTCADTVAVKAPNPSTTVNAVVLVATVLNPVAILPRPTPTPTSTPRPTGESVNQAVIAGPATLTIQPIPGATLAITYQKSLQPIQPTATPTPTP